MGRLSRVRWLALGSLIAAVIFVAGAISVPGGFISSVEWLAQRFSGSLWSPPPQVEGIEMTVETVGISRVDLQPIVLLKEKAGERRLPIRVGPLEANAISVVVERITVRRPLTADLLITTVRKAGADVAYVTIDDLRDDIFYARLILQTGRSQVEIDARPSDAIAVALRTGAPIYANQAVIDKAGIRPEGKPEKSA